MARTKEAALNGNAVRPEKCSNQQIQLNGSIEDEATDIERWRLLDERGRHTWHYLDTAEALKEWPQTTADRYHLGLSLVCLVIPQAHNDIG